MLDEPDALLSGELELLLPPELLLPGELLPPLLLPPEELPGLSAPPVAEPWPDRPKYENTLCFQLGWERSVVGSKFGADSSLVWSPENTKLTWPLLLALEEELLEADEGRSNIQGIATCLPPPLVLLELPNALELEPEEELPELELPGELLLPLEGELLLPELLLPGELLAPVLLPDELSDTTAKSILPEAGFRIRSLIDPICELELLVICEPVSWLTRRSWWLELLPVGLYWLPKLEELPELPDRELELPELCELLSLGELPGELDEDCACAPSARHAAHAITVRMICFLITCLSLVAV